MKQDILRLICKKESSRMKTKAQLLKPYEKDKELRILLSKALDRQADSQRKDVPAHTGFLTLNEREALRKTLALIESRNHVFYGGFLDAERVICVFLPSWMEEVNWEEEQSFLCAVEISVPQMAKLRHSDYLGALIGIGLTRDKFGDILLNEHGATLLLLKEVLPIVLSQWESVGRYPIQVHEIALFQADGSVKTCKQKVGTVASLRLDSVLSQGFSIGRNQAVELIEAGKVLRNDQLCEKVNQTVREGDRFSCRGMGKFVLTNVKGTSRKGRVILEMDCYQ